MVHDDKAEELEAEKLTRQILNGENDRIAE